MEPLMSNPRDNLPLQPAWKRDFLFKVFLHVNREFNDFQRECYRLVIGPEVTPETITRAIDKLNKVIGLLEKSGWSPKRADSDAVFKPDHYDRYPMEPTYFIVESGGFHWCIENFIKYVARYRFKNGVEDLRKAMRNLAMYVQWLDQNPRWSR